MRACRTGAYCPDRATTLVYPEPVQVPPARSPLVRARRPPDPPHAPLLAEVGFVLSGDAACAEVADRSLRRGHTDSTILVDREHRRPVARLPDRRAAGLARWLAAHLHAGVQQDVGGAAVRAEIEQQIAVDEHVAAGCDDAATCPLAVRARIEGLVMAIGRQISVCRETNPGAGCAA